MRYHAEYGTAGEVPEELRHTIVTTRGLTGPSVNQDEKK